MAIPQWLAGDPCVLHVDHRDALPGTTAEWPEWLSADCVATIRAAGVPLPWRHQREAAELAHAGRHVALSTPTASGKTLAYLLPLMAADMELSGVMVRSSSFSRVSLLSAAASTIISMLSPSSVTSATVVVSCSAAATCI